MTVTFHVRKSKTFLLKKDADVYSEFSCRILTEVLAYFVKQFY